MRTKLMRNALADLKTSIARIRNLAANIASNATASMVSSQVRELHETQQFGAVVLLSGYFEEFLKDAVRAHVTQLAKRTTNFDQLPEIIQNTHFENGGRVLNDISLANRRNRPTPFGIVAREDIAARLYSPCRSVTAKTYTLLWEAFANTKSNPGPDVVRDVGLSLGLEKVWPNIAAKSKGNYSDSALVSTLQDLITVRNACAHTGAVSPIPTVSRLIEYADCLELIAIGFVRCLEEEIKKW